MGFIPGRLDIRKSIKLFFILIDPGEKKIMINSIHTKKTTGQKKKNLLDKNIQDIIINV